MADDDGYREALIQDTVNRILEPLIGRIEIKFSWFRWRMLDEFPDLIGDDEIHALYLEHVVGKNQAKLPPPRVQDPRRPMEPGDSYVERQRQLMDDILKRPEPLKVDKPEFDYVGGKPLMDRTVGEIANAVGRKARAIVRIALGSRRDT